MTDRTSQSQRGGAGIVSLIVVVLIIIVAVVVLVLPRIGRRGHGSDYFFICCRGNLKGIGTAILAYQQQSDDLLPLIKPREAVPNGVNGAPTEANQTDYKLGDRRAPEDEMTWEVLGDQAMQNVWLLVTGKLVDDEMFRCSADAGWQPRDEEVAKYGWTDPHQYSYGMQWPYLVDAAGDANPAPLGVPNTVMLADLNPGGPVDKSRPPSNHSKSGTNFLLSDGSVAFSRREGFPRRTVSTLGFEGDEIYTNAAGVAGGLPQHDKDTSITLSGR